MTDGDAEVEARERRSKRGGCVAMDERHVWKLPLENRLDAEHHAARYAKERLARLHHREIVVGNNSECAQHLIEHFTMLSRDEVGRSRL